MRESLVNWEGDIPPKKCKGREETRNWSRHKDGKQPPGGKRMNSYLQVQIKWVHKIT